MSIQPNRSETVYFNIEQRDSNGVALFPFHQWTGFTKAMEITAPGFKIKVLKEDVIQRYGSETYAITFQLTARQ